MVFEVLDGEAVLLHMDSGVYFRLNKTGTRVWQLLEAHEGRDRIIETIAGEFDAPKDSIQSDVDALLAELIERRLVTSQ